MSLPTTLQNPVIETRARYKRSRHTMYKSRRLIIALLGLALRLPVVIDAATGRLALAMGLSTSKGAVFEPAKNALLD